MSPAPSDSDIIVISPSDAMPSKRARVPDMFLTKKQRKDRPVDLAPPPPPPPPPPTAEELLLAAELAHEAARQGLRERIEQGRAWDSSVRRDWAGERVWNDLIHSPTISLRLLFF